MLAKFTSIALLLLLGLPLGRSPSAMPKGNNKKISTAKHELPGHETTKKTSAAALMDHGASKNISRADPDKPPIRVLVAKMGLDGHDRGALVICRALRDAGMEVIYTGLFRQAQDVVKDAMDEKANVIAMSLLNGAHLTLFPKVTNLLAENGIDDVLVLGGGIIPEGDKAKLKTQGVHEVFGPGTPLGTIISYIFDHDPRKNE